jgi:hypothetical protein
MAAKGMSRSEIADVIGVGLLTVVKSFSDECKRGYTTCRRDLVACMWTAAKRAGLVQSCGWSSARASGKSRQVSHSATPVVLIEDAVQDGICSP